VFCSILFCFVLFHSRYEPRGFGSVPFSILVL
jgi:hypothetical protein